MRRFVLAGVLAWSIAPCSAQTLPSIAQLLPQVSVEPPLFTEIIDATTKDTTKRLLGPFTIRNNSRYDLKDLEINCSYIAPSETIIGNHTVKIFEIFKASTRQNTAA